MLYNLSYLRYKVACIAHKINNLYTHFLIIDTKNITSYTSRFLTFLTVQKHLFSYLREVGVYISI